MIIGEIKDNMGNSKCISFTKKSRKLHKSLLKLAGKVAKLACISSSTISTAESCTGGMLASTITEIPGASRYFSSGFITYSNQSKVDLLDIDPAIINQFGAVSEKIVTLMAMKCRQKTKTSISIAISGLAGPERGNERAPVGTVYIAITLPHGTKCYQFKFEGNRQQIRIQTCVEALKILLGELKILIIPCLETV